MDKRSTVGGFCSRMDFYEERRKKVQQFNMTSDVFCGKVLEDRSACEEVIRIILDEPGFTVKEVKAQYSIRNIENRSVILDILAEDMSGKLVNIEMQIRNDGDNQRRVRYYQASIDMSCLEKGVPYEELPDLYLIFITEKDFFAHKLGIYYVERRLKNIGNTVDNGIHEIYANLECECSNEKINELLSYMKKSDSSYQTETFPNVVRRVKFFKEKEKGVESMCRILEEERNEGREEGRKEGSDRINELIRRLLKDGRNEDMVKSLEEPEYQEQLLKEYNL